MAVSGLINCHVLAISGSRKWQLVAFFGARNSQYGRQIQFLLDFNVKTKWVKDEREN